MKFRYFPVTSLHFAHAADCDDDVIVIVSVLLALQPKDFVLVPRRYKSIISVHPACHQLLAEATTVHPGSFQYGIWQHATNRSLRSSFRHHNHFYLFFPVMEPETGGLLFYTPVFQESLALTNQDSR